VRECASVVNDNRLIGKLASGHMVAIQQQQQQQQQQQFISTTVNN